MGGDVDVRVLNMYLTSYNYAFAFPECGPADPLL